MTRRVNVVVVSSRCLIFHQEKRLVLHVRVGISEKKVYSCSIVTDSLHKNPEVGTMVPKNATSRVGVFLLK